jgi:hypothetical protein
VVFRNIPYVPLFLKASTPHIPSVSNHAHASDIYPYSHPPRHPTPPVSFAFALQLPSESAPALMKKYDNDSYWR